MATSKKYDFILFGCTGFTGKLAAEYLLEHEDKKQQDKKTISWAVCARNVEKAKLVLESLAKATTIPDILQADLSCTTLDDEEKLRQVVQQTKVVLTCSGPFAKYGTTLVKLCAELGVHYADITGESDFVRSMVQEHDATARGTGAAIISHCGNDCIPQDLTVYELHKYATSKGCTLQKVVTHVEFPEEARLSGGTVATATYQLGKPRTSKKDKDDDGEKSNTFDPLMTNSKGEKSEFTIKNISPKTDMYMPEFDAKAGPWIMAPVMVNCVRRSNALLGYNSELQYGDSQLRNPTWGAWVQDMTYKVLISGAIVLPSVFSPMLPQPGQGPDRETMEGGWLNLYGRAVMVDENGKEITLHSKFRFEKDVGYLYTAALLVETGMVLLAKDGLRGGVSTPAAALGSDLMQQILKEMEASFDIQEVDGAVSS